MRLCWHEVHVIWYRIYKECVILINNVRHWNSVSQLRSYARIIIIRCLMLAYFIWIICKYTIYLFLTFVGVWRSASFSKILMAYLLKYQTFTCPPKRNVVTFQFGNTFVVMCRSTFIQRTFVHLELMLGTSNYLFVFFFSRSVVQISNRQMSFINRSKRSKIETS